MQSWTVYKNGDIEAYNANSHHKGANLASLHVPSGQAIKTTVIGILYFTMSKLTWFED